MFAEAGKRKEWEGGPSDTKSPLLPVKMWECACRGGTKR